MQFRFVRLSLSGKAFWVGGGCRIPTKANSQLQNCQHENSLVQCKALIFAWIHTFWKMLLPSTYRTQIQRISSGPPRQQYCFGFRENIPSTKQITFIYFDNTDFITQSQCAGWTNCVHLSGLLFHLTGNVHPLGKQLRETAFPLLVATPENIFVIRNWKKRKNINNIWVLNRSFWPLSALLSVCFECRQGTNAISNHFYVFLSFPHLNTWNKLLFYSKHPENI